MLDVASLFGVNKDGMDPLAAMVDNALHGFDDVNSSSKSAVITMRIGPIVQSSEKRAMGGASLCDGFLH